MKASNSIEPRGKHRRRRNPIFLIATEGNNKTEKNYFLNFRQRQGPQIVFSSGNYTDPVKMMKQLKDDAKDYDLSSENGDRAYCLIDTDTSSEKQTQIDEAEKMENGLTNLIVSSPCFEEWFLCHFTYSTKHRTSSETVTELQRFIPEYSKNGNYFEQLKDKTELAATNAKKLKKYHADLKRDSHSIESNPSTEVYIIIETLLTNDI